MEITPTRIFMRQWDDLHYHARQGKRMITALQHLFPYCARATMMPNTEPPILTGGDVVRYKADIMNVAHHLRCPSFVPLMTLYITEETTPQMIDEAHASGVRLVKVYPKDVTTGSKYGVKDYRKIIPALRRCGELGMITLLHGENPDLEVEGLNKEWKFLPILSMLLEECPGKFVLEHISTHWAVGYVLSNTSGRLAATVTPHHLVHTLDDLLGYGLASGFKANPVLSCKPVIKMAQDRRFLLDAVLSGDPRFFHGSDGALHPDGNRGLNGCACGIWNPIATPSMLIELFREHGKLALLENYTSRFGAEFYGLTLNSRQICFERGDYQVPEKVAIEGTDEFVTPWMAGAKMKWRQVH